MRGRKKKTFAGILYFMLSVILAILAFSMPEVRADDHYCKGCEERKDCDYCMVCEKCEDCIEMCDRCGEVCLDCHEELGGSEETKPCADCGRCKVGADYCVFCGRCEDCVDICDQCGAACLECHEYLGGDSEDEFGLCPGCARCKADGSTYCHSCGYCEDCVEVCTNCELCLDCAKESGLHCEECDECFEEREQCPDEGMHCTEHCIICDDCGKCMVEAGEDPCEYCGHCPDCCGLYQCDDCGMCVEDPAYGDHFCEDCGTCLEIGAERCEECGLCEICCNDRAIEMGCSCGLGCWLNLEEDHFCADCGLCFGEALICDTCLLAEEYRCVECCAELAWMEGCDCEKPVCVNDETYDAHMASVHGGGLEGHQATARKSWSFDASYHWHDCRLCDDSAHVTGKARHTYDSKGICVECGFNSTSKLMITSQPKDRHAKIHYAGWYPRSNVEVVEDKDNTVSFTVVAYGKNAKKGLQYQWYCKISNRTWRLEDGTGVYSDYCSGANAPVLTIAVPNDACRMTDDGDPYQFYCVITDEDGNSVTSDAAKMIVKHDYLIYMPSNLRNEKGHVLSCAGDGCMKDSKLLPHVYGEYKWALKSDGTQDYMYRECADCGWKEKYRIHEHQFNFGTLYEVNYDELTVIEENDKIHRYEYEYEYNGKLMRAGFTVRNHFVTCSVPGCNFKLREEHDWGAWQIVNHAWENKPGGLFRTCKICELEQTWSKTGYRWHTHPINVTNGHAKETAADFMTMTDARAIANAVKKAMDEEDLDIADEEDVVLLFPDPVEGKMATGAKVKIDCVTGIGNEARTQNLEVTEVLPGKVYAFVVPKSGLVQLGEPGKQQSVMKIDYQASFIEVTFTYKTCTHPDGKIKGAVAATCTEIGYSGDRVCTYCEHLIEKGSYIAPTGHAEGVPATENVPALNKKGEPLYATDPNSGVTYPVYKIQVACVRNCDDCNDNKGSYTGDLICPKCGEVVKKGKYYPRQHSYELLNDIEEPARTEYIEEGYREAVAPVDGKDGYSGDYHCWACDEWKFGRVIKGQTISKVRIEISEMPIYGSEIKGDVFTFSDGTEAGSYTYFFSWFGYEDDFGQYEWFRPGEVIDVKVNPEWMQFDLRVAPKDGYWFPASVDEMQVFVNGKQIRNNNYSFGSGKGVRLDLVEDSGLPDYGELCISADMAMTGFCGVAYDVNGGEGNIPCLAVEKGTEVTLSECTFTNPDGMAFDHWEINGKSYHPGEKIAVHSLVVAKAIWKNPLKIAKKSITLYNTIAIDFKVSKSDLKGYHAPYVAVTQNGVTRKISEYHEDGDLLVFTCRVAPQQMGDVVTAVPHAISASGKDLAGEALTYSVSEYCYNMLGKEAYQGAEYATFRRLLVDILLYGDAAQTYADYKTTELVGRNLTAEQLAMGTDVTVPMVYQSVKDKFFATVDEADELASMEAASLYLEAAVVIQFKYVSNDPAGLRIVVTDDAEGANVLRGYDTNVTQIDDKGRYYVNFDGLNAGEMRKTVYATATKGGKKVSNTYRYSIESYVSSMKGRGIPNLDNLLDAMMRYGDSASDFVAGR